ncbi:MAG TPA: sugar ABC transporter permease [Gaiellaceae bacterium]|jgi:ABC-type sugar transport system permease subunit
MTSIGSALRVRAARRRSKAQRSETLIAWAFLLPLAAVFAAFYLWPAFNTIVSSLFRWSLLDPWKATDTSTWDFAGLGNYRETLSDPDFWNAAFNTLVWLVFFPLLVTGFSLFVTILIWHVRHGAGAFRTVFILPMTISLTAAGVIWSFVYNPQPTVGLLSAVVDALHLNFAIHWGPLQAQTGEWLSDPGVLHLGFADLRFANLAVIVAAFWAFTGFGVITLTAGLTSVSHDLVEAATVDGARSRDIVRYVLLPALRRPLIVVAVVSIIFALRVFDIVFVMTNGGPAQDTQVLALLLWNDAFAFIDEPMAGAAAAIAVLLSATLIIIASPYLRTLRRRDAR